MNKSKWIRLICVNLIIALLIVSPFLPGPNNTFFNSITILFHMVGQVAGLLCVVLFPLSLILLAIQFGKKRANRKLSAPIKLLAFSVTIFLSAFWGSDSLRNISRDIAMNNAETLIAAIEQHNSKTGKYPDKLEVLTPNAYPYIHNTGVMGIPKYTYHKLEHGYTVAFTQYVLFGFNVEIVKYHPLDRHSIEEEYAPWEDAGKQHWRYYIYD